MKLRKIFYSLCAFTLFTGCSTISPTISDYRIDTHLQKQDFTNDGCKKSSLKVAQAFSSNTLMSLGMSYGEGKYKQFTFSQSQWAISPNRALTSEIISYIRATKLFKNVQISKSRTRNDFLLETTVDDFMQYFSKDSLSSYVKISLTFTLIDMKTSRVISTKSFDIKKDVKKLDAIGGVIALNEALEEVLQESGIWIDGVCK